MHTVVYDAHFHHADLKWKQLMLRTTTLITSTDAEQILIKKKDPFNLQLTQVRYPLLPLNIFTVYNRVTILPRFAFQTNQISLHPWTYILILIN